jgi:hypothetical protein
MGCCASPSISSGEQTIRRSIHSMDIWNITYLELKSNLTNNSLNGTIEKSKVKEVILKLFCKSEIHSVIHDLILSKLDQKCSIYLVIFYLFPFISSNKTTYKNFFEVTKQLNKNQDVHKIDILKYLREYFTFILISVPKEIRSFISTKEKDSKEKEELLSDLDYDKTEIFNMSNIDKELEKIDDYFERCLLDSIEDNFKFVCEEYNGMNFYYQDIRDFYIFKYAHK